MQLKSSLLRNPSLPWLGIALAIAGALSFRPVADSDTGWHLALGRLIDGGEFPRTNALAWTQPSHEFYPTSWLFDWGCYVLTRAFGVAGLQLLVLALTSVCLCAVAFVCHREGQVRWLVVPIALLLADRVVPRPHMASWGILAVCTAICMTVEGRPSWRRAACIPLIALGSNLHAGAIFSTIALGAFCVVEALRERTARAFVREGLISVGGIMALMANPGLTYNVYYAVRHLSMYETLQLTEFEAPNLSNAPGFFIVAPVGVALALFIARRRPALALVTAGFAAGGIFAVRLAFKFYLASSPAFAVGIARLKERFGPRAEVFAALLVFGAGVAFTAPTLAQLRIAPRFDEQWLPVRAVAFAKQAGLDGKVWNGFNDGGYLEWAMPEVPAYQDARVLAYDAEFFHAQQRAEATPEQFERYLTSNGVEWAITTNLPSDLSGNGLIRSAKWALVYWDDLSEIYVRRDVTRFADVIARFEYKRLSPWVSAQQLISLAGEGERPDVEQLEIELQRFEMTSPNHPVGRLVRCAVATRLARPDAQQACAEARASFRTEEMRALADRAGALHSEK